MDVFPHVASFLCTQTGQSIVVFRNHAPADSHALIVCPDGTVHGLLDVRYHGSEIDFMLPQDGSRGVFRWSGARQEVDWNGRRFVLSFKEHHEWLMAHVLPLRKVEYVCQTWANEWLVVTKAQYLPWDAHSVRVYAGYGEDLTCLKVWDANEQPAWPMLAGWSYVSTSRGLFFVQSMGPDSPVAADWLNQPVTLHSVDTFRFTEHAGTATLQVVD